MNEYRCYMVDVDIGEDRFVSGPGGELISYDTPETRFTSAADAEVAAEKCRVLHPDARVQVNGKRY